MSGPSIGALRQRLTLETPVRTGEEGGTAVISWNAIATLSASITPQSGREIVLADGVAARVTHEIVIRYGPGVAPAMRFTAAGRIFEIHAVLDIDERRRWLKCLCEERLP
jgi:SPP1 family predicted phage head-tail adaptor